MDIGYISDCKLGQIPVRRPDIYLSHPCVAVFFINSDPNLIDEFLNIISKIIADINDQWIQKIEQWRKRIDCEYDWGCEICPYQEECYEIKQVLIEREKIKKS